MGPSEDELRARATLAEMQQRLARGPYDALGLPGNATASEVRSAFLELTKIYHPARFARLAQDIQRLSNEVFLSLRGAHDAITKAIGGTPRTTRSTQMPPMGPAGTGPMRAPTSPLPVVTLPPSAPPAPGTDRPTVRMPSSRVAVPGSASQSQSQPLVAKPASKSEPNVAGGARPPTPQPTAPSSGRIPTPAVGVRITGAIPTTRAGSPPVGAGDARAASPTAAAPAASTGGAPFNERAELMNAMEMIRQEQWPQAVAQLQQLASRVPASKAYRAMLCYARGREAQVAGRIADAIAELERALQIDPAMPLAKATLAQLQQRRR